MMESGDQRTGGEFSGYIDVMIRFAEGREDYLFAAKLEDVKHHLSSNYHTVRQTETKPD